MEILAIIITVLTRGLNHVGIHMAKICYSLRPYTDIQYDSHLWLIAKTVPLQMEKQPLIGWIYVKQYDPAAN